MTRAVLVASSPELATRIGAVCPDLQVLSGPLAAEPHQIAHDMGGGELPDVLVIGGEAPLDDVLALAGRLAGEWPGTGVVLAASPPPELWPAVMRAGVADVLTPDADALGVHAVLQRAAWSASGRRAVPAAVAGSPGAGGRVITVVSPKGGVGKTTVAANLAVGLAAVAPQSTVLVDLDLQFGDVACALGLVPEYTLPDVVHGPAAEDSMVLKTFLARHPTGVLAICGAESPAAGDTVTGRDVSRLITSLARQFRYVLVDTAAGLSEVTLAALDLSSDAVVLSTLDVAGIRGLRKELDVLSELSLVPDRRHVVLNLVERGRGIAVADVEATLGTGVDLLIPRSKAVPISSDEGIPLLQRGHAREPATEELRRLLDRLTTGPGGPGAAPVTARTGRGRGWFGRGDPRRPAEPVPTGGRQ